jgi:hypothetical protein
MKDQITIYINDRPVTIYRGMKVKHALISFDQAIYEAVELGNVVIEDSRGFEVGLEGSLREGSKLFTRTAGDR